MSEKADLSALLQIIDPVKRKTTSGTVANLVFQRGELGRNRL
jgi:hypothetical protein